MAFDRAEPLAVEQVHFVARLLGSAVGFVGSDCYVGNSGVDCCCFANFHVHVEAADLDLAEVVGFEQAEAWLALEVLGQVWVDNWLSRLHVCYTALFVVAEWLEEEAFV